ncbi:FAD:protein FMN transferase (plasmid) [Ruegeria sp. AD91A]|uniref:FAD:protein FMN transferase n=1 Tax=Ruegeria sp. AD91A TaxID=2293862 RepID=UPI000E4A4EDF|nr:FAD:protein FMN transferase [Ruegeria sp. AD91A]AXT28997.1 FAD:protein FMN transferase [Ruegeria sp. AD91A]
MINRRRFLAISAAALASPSHALPTRWRGYAMGADIGLTLDADPVEAKHAIASLRSILEKCETLFSLYRPDSALSELNRTGHLKSPDPAFVSLLQACNAAYDLTNGRFDPTVQPLWQATSVKEVQNARALIGWDRVRLSKNRVQLGQGQALTLNGIAQGFATDLVVHALRKAGWEKVLVNIGEYFASGRQWLLGVSDPVHGLVEVTHLKDRAIATSSPGVMLLRSGGAHIIDPMGEYAPLWSTVSIQAPDAAAADALSTAFCYASESEIAATLARAAGDYIAICVRPSGKVVTLQG